MSIGLSLRSRTPRRARRAASSPGTCARTRRRAQALSPPPCQARAARIVVGGSPAPRRCTGPRRRTSRPTGSQPRKSRARHEQAGKPAQLDRCDGNWDAGERRGRHDTSKQVVEAPEHDDDPGQERKRPGVHARARPADAVIEAGNDDRHTEASGENGCRKFESAARYHRGLRSGHVQCPIMAHVFSQRSLSFRRRGLRRAPPHLTNQPCSLATSLTRSRSSLMNLSNSAPVRNVSTWEVFSM
ncbi:hypothetical protein ACVWZ6_005336 [Bradyrhizobium sp. GM6.1]